MECIAFVARTPTWLLMQQLLLLLLQHQCKQCTTLFVLFLWHILQSKATPPPKWRVNGIVRAHMTTVAGPRGGRRHAVKNTNNCRTNIESLSVSHVRNDWYEGSILNFGYSKRTYHEYTFRGYIKVSAIMPKGCYWNTCWVQNKSGRYFNFTGAQKFTRGFSL